MNQQESMPFNRRVGQNVRRFRQFVGLTQEQLAERMSELGHNMEQATMAKIETGTRGLKLEEASALAGLLSVDVIQLWGHGSDLDNARAERLAALRTRELARERYDRIKKEEFDAEREYRQMRWQVRVADERVKKLGGEGLDSEQLGSDDDGQR